MSYKILHFDDCQMTKVGFRQIVNNYTHIEFETNYKINNNENLFRTLARLNPDILVINLDTVSCKIVDKIINHITESFHRIRTVLVSNSISKQLFETFCSKGILGFLYLNSKTQDIINCLNRVCEKKTFVSNEFREKFRENLNADKFIIESFKTLTPKELKVIELIIVGKTSSEIAEILHNSKRTIETHRQHIAEKFDMLGQGRLTLFLIERKTLITELLASITVEQ